MPYLQLYYHLVWTTKNKHPLITTDIESHLYRLVSNKIDDLKGMLYAIGGMPDHIHLIVFIPPTLSLTQFIGQIKGATSHTMGKTFMWQEEYGAFTVSQRNLKAAIHYVKRQKQHHADNLLFDVFEP